MEIKAEQAHVDVLYEHLDRMKETADGHLVEAMRPAQIRTHQGQFERDVSAKHHADRAARLASAEHGLVIGRLDLDDDDPLYIGRIGLHDDDYDPLLIDWRAPAAVRFYRATPADRLGVRRRRHIHLKGRRVARLDDDVLALADLDDTERSHLTGEGALLASLTSARTGRMADIVATIQAEQDRVIRSDIDGILVVEGGPGTGKTVVALHRAAYLLYTYRDLLARTGVLIVGPNPTFLQYIDQVLPGLGESDVVLSSVGDMYPGVVTSRSDAAQTAVIKGDLGMVRILEQAVASHQRAPIGGLEIATDRDVYFLDDHTCRRIRDGARERAERDGLAHNRLRGYVVREVLDELVNQALKKLEGVLEGVEVPEETDDESDRDLAELLDHAAIRRELYASDGVRDALDVLWPELTPEGLVAQLFTDSRFRDDVAPQLTAAERAALRRDEGRAWTVSDIPLLDEVATLVGELDATLARQGRLEMQQGSQRARQIQEQQELIRDAYDVAMDMAIEEEVAMPVDASLVLSRYHDDGGPASLAERAKRDRGWTYGHVIVDEAQELSPMAWRMLERRCPALSMTVVGDVGQASTPGGVASWADALEPLAGTTWRRASLTVNYRTTAPIMAVAADVLAAGGADTVAPRSVRIEGDQPWAHRVPSGAVVDELPVIVRRERELLGEGTLAVITPPALVESCTAILRTEFPDVRAGDAHDLLDASVAVLTPAQAKGLEFDGAIVVAPDEIVTASPRGHADLYVAVTRPTRRLGVLHGEPLPPGLEALESAPHGADCPA